MVRARHRHGRRLDLVEGRAHRRERRASSRRSTSSRRATRSRTPRRSWRGSRQWVTDQGATLEVMGFGATGYAADVLEESVQVRRQHRRDRRAHDVGDALLRRRRRHLRHRRAGHQGPVHAERRHQELPPVEPVLGRQRHAAAGDGRSVRRAGHRLRRRRLRGRAVAQVQLRLRRLPRLRPRELPEGGLLEGGAARRPGAGAAEERLAVRRADPAHGGAGHEVRAPGRHAAQPGRASRRRSTTSRSACPAPRSTSTRTPARPARSAPRSRRCAWSSGAGYSTFIGIDAAIDLEFTSNNDETTRCHFCPNNCARARSSTPRRPTGETARYISRLLLREGHRRVRGGDDRAHQGAQEADEGVPEPGRLRVEAGLPALLRPGADARGRRARSTTSRSKKTLARRQARRRSSGHFERSSAEAWEKRRRMRIGIPKVLNIWSTGAVLADLPRDARASRSRTSSSPTTRREEMWVEGGKYGSIDPCYPSKVAQAHIHNLLFHHHTDEKKLQLHLLPVLTHVPTFVKNAMDTTSCPIVAGAPEVMKAAFTKEIDFFAERGIKYLDPALTLHRADAAASSSSSTTWGPLLGVTEDESDFACEQALEGAATASTPSCRRKGARDPRDGRGGEPRRGPDDRPPVSLGPGAEPRRPRGVPGARLPDPLDALDPARIREWLHRFFESDIKAGRIETPLEVRTSGRRTTRPTRCRRCGRRSSPRATRTWSCSICRRFKCGHDAPTYGLIDSIISTSATPYSALHDIDANKPGGSIKIRVKTYAHTLKLHEERLEDAAKKHGRAEVPHRGEAAAAAGAQAAAARGAQAAGPGAREDDQRDQSRRSPRIRSELEAQAGRSNPAEQAAKDAGLVRLGIKKLVNDQEVVARV